MFFSAFLENNYFWSSTFRKDKKTCYAVGQNITKQFLPQPRHHPSTKWGLWKTFFLNFNNLRHTVPPPTANKDNYTLLRVV